MMDQEREEVEQERAGLHKRIMDLYDALDRANARTERVLTMKADPPIFTSADPPIFMPTGARKMTPSTGIVFDEVSTFRDIYFKDFLKSFWRRWRRLRRRR